MPADPLAPARPQPPGGDGGDPKAATPAGALAGLPAVRLAEVRLCVLLDAQPDAAGFERLFTSLLAAGVRMFQLRDKAAPDAVILDRARRGVALARQADARAPALVTINDRVSLAGAAGIDGVHVGGRDLPVKAARELLGPAVIIGRTAHDMAEARAASHESADYLGIGPCFPSATKSFASQAPREFLRQAAAEIPRPVFAIGGITTERLGELAALGIHRVAVSAAITAAPDPAAAAREFLTALRASNRPPRLPRRD